MKKKATKNGLEIEEAEVGVRGKGNEEKKIKEYAINSLTKLYMYV